MSSTSPTSWSALLSERYRCVLTPDCQDWFDTAVWQQRGLGEFQRAVSPQTLLVAAPEEIWPGLMPCDLLPIISDSAGNWLCLRIGAHGKADQIVQWYHGGGDWLPWGNRLADAIVFSCVADRLPGPGRRLAEPAEKRRQNPCPLNDPFIGWAIEHQSNRVREMLANPDQSKGLAKVLLEFGIAEVAVRCELAQAATYQPWATQLDPQTAKRLGIDWNDIVEWTFDVARMPKDAMLRIRNELNRSDVCFVEQDWSELHKQCRHVLDLTTELAWPWDLTGYACERLGRPDEAVAAYRQGARCSTFTDQSVRMNTHWAQSQAAKFSVARLMQLDPENTKANTYESMLFGRDHTMNKQQVFDFWMRQADATIDSGNDVAATELLMRAGWDLGAASISDYGGLLDAISDAASRAGQDGKATLTKTHRQCLADRYGI